MLFPSVFSFQPNAYPTPSPSLAFLNRLWKTSLTSLLKLCPTSHHGAPPLASQPYRAAALQCFPRYRFGEPIMVKGVVAHLPGAAGGARPLN
jgi:hypothetical protein